MSVSTVKHPSVMLPEVQLLLNANSYSDKKINNVTKLIKSLIWVQVHVELTKRKTFCVEVIKAKAEGRLLNAVDLIGTEFFQSMMSENVSDSTRDLFEKHREFHPIELNLTQYFQETFKASDFPKIEKWFRYFMINYISKEEMESASECSEKYGEESETLKKNKQIGIDLFKECQSSKFSRLDLNALLDDLSTIYERLKENKVHPIKVYQSVGSSLNVTLGEIDEELSELTKNSHTMDHELRRAFLGRYIELFIKCDDPIPLIQSNINMLKGSFRTYFVDKSES